MSRAQDPQRPLLSLVPTGDAPDECGCSGCSDELDESELIDSLLGDLTETLDSDDPVDGELSAALLMAARGVLDVAAIEHRATPEALALLLAIGSVTDGEPLAVDAADRLAAAGIAPPAWAATLRAPVTVTRCCVLRDTTGVGSILLCSIARAGHGHVIATMVDDFDCGAASELRIMDGDEVTSAIDLMQEAAATNGVEFAVEELDQTAFRARFESAVRLRADHDLDRDSDEVLFDDEGPGYPVLAMLAATWLRSLPLSDNLIRAHDADCAERAVAVVVLTVTVRGTTPPTWRRLEVPAEFTLDELHTAIQLAFGWDGDQEHGFEPSPADQSATLAEIIPVGSAFTYRYGELECSVLVEARVAENADEPAPRCVDGEPVGFDVTEINRELADWEW